MRRLASPLRATQCQGSASRLVHSHSISNFIRWFLWCTHNFCCIAQLPRQRKTHPASIKHRVNCGCCSENFPTNAKQMFLAKNLTGISNRIFIAELRRNLCSRTIKTEINNKFVCREKFSTIFIDSAATRWCFGECPTYYAILKFH